jgi:hypothetical protein
MPAFFDFLRLRNHSRTPKPMSATTRSAIPAPIPPIAPADRPPFFFVFELDDEEELLELPLELSSSESATSPSVAVAVAAKPVAVAP